MTSSATPLDTLSINERFLRLMEAMQQSIDSLRKDNASLNLSVQRLEADAKIKDAALQALSERVGKTFGEVNNSLDRAFKHIADSNTALSQLLNRFQKHTHEVRGKVEHCDTSIPLQPRKSE